eukprot:TRINITY_DN112135_c0_g1_i1.p1 TRINITY_DN112135_c0_g1~~TRINITY_DN112135_c0_g1_i1.p1  ORF type:complete len:292 (-),score=42.95 TRINITY_DN112135_c0_g1_i1:43-918(-)
MATAADMLAIILTQAAAVCALFAMLTVADHCKAAGKVCKAKVACENWFLVYGIFWIAVFAVIVASGIYEAMDKWAYLLVCGGLAMPLLLQPVILPAITGESSVPLLERHCTKATVWIAIYSFLGNYWGTHYFYSVLGASYTMAFLPDHQLNGVPVCMYFATHFYFCFYHALGSKMMRFFLLRYQRDVWRDVFMIAFVFTLSYVVAFMETFSIAAFPYYTFKDRSMMYTVGSAFYALYLVVSFPMFLRLDNNLDKKHTFVSACLEAFATFMMIMTLLDAVRLWLGLEFRMAA